jgi:hypothetical protein
MDTTIIKAPAPAVTLMTMATMALSAIAAKVRATIDAQVPEGYEDETGFHFGTPDFKN